MKILLMQETRHKYTLI